MRIHRYISINRKSKLFLCLLACLVCLPRLRGQEAEADSLAPTQNVRIIGSATGNHIRLRWAPTNTEAWLDGKTYGYKLMRFTIFRDSTFLDESDKFVADETFKPAPLAEWEAPSLQSDYAAVIAQALYGEDFDLAPAGDTLDMGGLINQATDIEQRFAVSLFAAENDYSAALLAGWGWTDTTSRQSDQYVYVIILNRPERQAGDTASVYIGYQNVRTLPPPVDLNATFGDSIARLSWDYALLSDVYHSYHVERMKSGTDTFRRVTSTPVTLASDGLARAFYNDSLPANDVEYDYRIIGLTTFGEESPPSDTIRGKGKTPILCPPPYILAGDFVAVDTAYLSWEYSCPNDSGLIEQLQIRRSEVVDGDYLPVAYPAEGNNELRFHLPYASNYLKLRVVYTDSSWVESFPYSVNQVDSVPPAPPIGLKVSVDTAGVARLTWTANEEPDIMGYRILRGFTPTEEASSIAPGLVPTNEYADTLSLDLINDSVYYALTAIDNRYNESALSPVVAAAKPDNSTPADPVFTSYERDGNAITLHWITDPNDVGVRYSLVRQGQDATDTVFRAAADKPLFTDEPPASGTYSYLVIAANAFGRQSVSPNPLSFDFIIDKAMKISGFNSYTDDDRTYIELFWNRHPQAVRYRLYKATDDGRLSLWKEVDSSVTRLVDEQLLRDSNYKYVLMFINQEGRTSQPSTITVEF
jgi:fibronectin type 3 domain-containing protein